MADSEKIKGMLSHSGFDFTNTPEDADFILFNTCAVREHAEDRVFGNVGALKNIKRKHPQILIALCGCMMEQEHVANRIYNSFPFVSLVFGTHSLQHFPELYYSALVDGNRVFERGNDDKISIKVTLDDGNTISFCTNLDKYELHTAMGNIEAIGYAGKEDKRPAVKKLNVNNLQSDMIMRFNICSDKKSFDEMVKLKMVKEPDYAKIMESAKKTGGVTKEQKVKLDNLETKVRCHLRESLTDDVIEPLQQALKDANVRKEDRTAILSKCRKILTGDPTSEKEKNALLNVVRCIVTNKPIFDFDLKAAGLEGFHDPTVKVAQGDDIDTIFSINDYLNGK